MARKRLAESSPLLNSLAEFESAHAAALDAAARDPESVAGLHEREGNPRPLAPRVPEVDDWVKRQLDNTAANADTWKERMKRPKKDPIEQALKSAGKYKSRMTESLNEGRYEKGLRKVDEAAMLATIEATPSSALVDGVRRREQKIRGKVERMRPLLVAHANVIDGMKVDTDSDREAKMLANLKGMRALGKKLRD